MLLLTLVGCNTLILSNDQISNYINDKNQISSSLGETCKVFPDDIPTSAKNVNYYFEYTQGLLDPEIQFFLEYTLSEEEYYVELNRIKSIKCNQPIKCDERKYIYPAYVAMENYDGGFEYVLIDEVNYRFIYIFLKFFSNTSRMHFDLSYLPKKLNYTNSAEFSIY